MNGFWYECVPNLIGDALTALFFSTVLCHTCSELNWPSSGFFFLFQLLTSDSLGFLAFLPISSPPSLKPGFPLLRAVADILWPSKGLWGGLPPAPPLPTFPISSTALVCEEPRVPRSLYPNSPLPFQGSPCGWPSPWNMTQKGEQDAHMRGGTGPSKVWGLAESQWWV